MARSALDVELSMAKVIQALKTQIESQVAVLQSNVALMEMPLNIQVDEHMKLQKTVSLIDKNVPTDNMVMSSSEPNLATFTPPIKIGQVSLTYSTDHTPAPINRFEHTAPNTRYKTEDDKKKATTTGKPVTKSTPPTSCSLEFKKVSLKNNCADVGRQKVDEHDSLVQPANDSKIEIKRSIGF